MPADSANNAGQNMARRGAGHDDVRDASQARLSCPACGAGARRNAAQYCATCGRRLDGEDYFPTDTLRASYHQQRRPTQTRPSEITARVKTPYALTTEELSRHHASPRVERRAKPIPAVSSTANQNGASTTALAFVTYALVPYLGILFCPGALVCGSVGWLRAVRAPHVGGRRTSVTSIVLGVVILGAQLVLWWILYKVPEWARGAGGF